jgi:uncharacterized protein YcnI
MHTKIALALALGALAIPAGAQAHVSLHPNTVPTGSGPTVDVRVPNETSNARTVKVDVKIPPGFTLLMPAPVPGWTSRVIHEKLAKPIKTDDGVVTEQATEVIWTADRGRGTPPDEFQGFPLLMGVPGKAGQVLTFKTVQTYSNGEVVRWIGAKDSDNPAPTVAVTAGGEAKPAATPAATAAATPAKSDGGGSNGLAIAALIVGALGLATGIAGLTAARRRTAGV